MTDNDGSHPSHNNSANEPSSEPKTSDEVPLDPERGPSPTSDEAHRSAERDYWRRQICVAKWLNIITFIAAIVAIFGLVFVALGIRATNKNTEEANRAWVAPLRVEFSPPGPSKSGDEAPIRVIYKNIGREPALDVQVHQEPFTVETPPAHGHPIYEMSIPDNNMCQTENFTNIGAIWPDGIEHFSMGIEGTTKITDDIMTVKHVLGYHGCFVYRTFERLRNTKYFYILTPMATTEGAYAPISSWIWSICPGAGQMYAK